MPQSRTWTSEADQTIIIMRSDGASWAVIGETLGLSRNTIIERGRRLHAAPPKPPPKPDIEREFLEDPNRAALPAGHPLTWGLLTDAPYPEESK